tara:strand:- start:242 stop:478 length:237 start_codon:yes stop_codon:yes gene_type:complete
MATLTPLVDTFVIIYDSVGKDKYAAQTYAKEARTTEISPSDEVINTYTSFSSFNSALAAVGQPTTSFNPFTDNQSPTD